MLITASNIFIVILKGQKNIKISLHILGLATYCKHRKSEYGAAVKTEIMGECEKEKRTRGSIVISQEKWWGDRNEEKWVTIHISLIPLAVYFFSWRSRK